MPRVKTASVQTQTTAGDLAGHVTCEHNRVSWRHLLAPLNVRIAPSRRTWHSLAGVCVRCRTVTPGKVDDHRWPTLSERMH